MDFPKDCKYTSEHEWIRVESGNVVVVGITNFAQGELGDIVYVEVESVDESFEKDEVFGTVEAVKTTSDLFMPIAGKVVAFNKELDENEGDNPTLINTDPYGEGWVIKIECNDIADLDSLMDADAYAASIG